MPVFSEIMTQDVLCYDPAFHSLCVDFCKERRLTIMPAAFDDCMYYELNRDDNFDARELVDSNRRNDIVNEAIYRFNGEMINLLKQIVQPLMEPDVYRAASDSVIELATPFRKEVFRDVKRKKLIDAMQVNAWAGTYVSNFSDNLMQKMRKRLPQTVDDSTWEEACQTLKEYVSGRMVSALTPMLVYRTRREWLDTLRVVAPEEDVFKPDVYEKFRHSSLLFVMDRGKRCGVVHFSDYNRLPVFTYTFERMHQLERQMVMALARRKLSVQDLIDARNSMDPPPVSEREMRSVLERKQHDKSALLRYHDLEKLYLKTLLVLYNHRRENEPHPFTPIDHPNNINLLRNRIAHSNDLVELADASQQNLIYDFKSFASFYRQHRALEIAYRQVLSQNQLLSIMS